jgi:hypothetical protein
VENKDNKNEEENIGISWDNDDIMIIWSGGGSKK